MAGAPSDPIVTSQQGSSTPSRLVSHALPDAAGIRGPNSALAVLGRSGWALWATRQPAGGWLAGGVSIPTPDGNPARPSPDKLGSVPRGARGHDRAWIRLGRWMGRCKRWKRGDCGGDIGRARQRSSSNGGHHSTWQPRGRLTPWRSLDVDARPPCYPDKSLQPGLFFPLTGTDQGTRGKGTGGGRRGMTASRSGVIESQAPPSSMVRPRSFLPSSSACLPAVCVHFWGKQRCARPELARWQARANRCFPSCLSLAGQAPR